MHDPGPRIFVEYRQDQSILIIVNGRTSIVHSAHLVDERIAQLLRPDWGEPVEPPLTVNENSIIRYMRDLADQNGLWSEVKQHYDSCRKNGDCAAAAAFHALYEWDI
jgi:hypothetical protein